MTPRDKTKPESYYREAIQKRKDAIAELEQNISTPGYTPTPMICTWLQAQYIELGDLMYSAGETLEDIRPVFETALYRQALKMQLYRQHRQSLQENKEESSDDFPEFKKTSASLVEHYYDVLLKLSKAVLLNVDNALFKRYAWDATRPGIDYAFDRLINYKLADWPVSGKLHYAKKFEAVHLVLQAGTEPERIQHLTTYASGWMQKMKGHPLFGPHMLRDLNYTGYWCFVAPAIGLISQTRDESLHGLKYYPKDFIIRAENTF